MKTFITIILLLSMPSTYAMRAKDVGSSSSDESWSDYKVIKKQKVVEPPQKVTEKFFVVDAHDPSRVHAFKDRSALNKSMMRQLVKLQGVTIGGLYDELEAFCLRYKADGRLAVHCPDNSCSSQMSSQVNAKELAKNVFIHWYFTQQHQPGLFQELNKLIGISKQDAIRRYDKYGLPKSKLVPLGKKDAQVIELMDMEEDEINENEQDHDEVSSSSSEINYSELNEKDYENAVNKPWFLLADNVDQTSSFLLYQASTRQEVVKQLLQIEIAKLTLESEHVSSQSKLFMGYEELAKQLMVQQKDMPKKLICIYDDCDCQFEQDAETEKTVDQLFKRMTLHYMQKHPVGFDTLLARQINHRASTNFDVAYERYANANGPSKLQQPQL